MKRLFYALVLSLGLPAAPALAEFDVLSPIPNGRCVLIVASRPDIGAAGDYIDGLENAWPFAQVFPSSTGWYAVSVGSLTEGEKDGTLRAWKRTGRIPQDSYCSSGSNLGAPVDWRVAVTPSRDGGPYIANGILHIPNGQGGYSRRSMDNGRHVIVGADGETIVGQTVTQVRYAGLPPLGAQYSRWRSELDGRISALAQDVFEGTGYYSSFQDAGSGLGYFDRVMFQLLLLETFAETQ